MVYLYIHKATIYTTKTMLFHVLWSKSKYWLLIAVVILLALYPLSFHSHIPKWDSVRGYLPYRFFISDYLQDGHMPLWNPFQRLGHPGYSDLQSGCWYPITWLIMLFGQYDIASLIAEVIITFVVAGWGMFRLSSYVHGCNRTAFLLALSYALSGCMVGSAQLMVFLIGMAWLPWILYAFIRILKGGGARYAGLLAFFLMCNITGASPAFTIVLIYALPLIFLYYLWRTSDWRILVKHFVFQQYDFLVRLTRVIPIGHFCRDFLEEYLMQQLILRDQLNCILKKTYSHPISFPDVFQKLLVCRYNIF